VANAAFFIFLRLQRGNLIKGFRGWLGQNSLEELKVMIKQGKYPAVKSDWVAACVEFKDGIESIPFEMFFEFIAEANPELADYINSLGREGGKYLGGLRACFLDLLEHPEKVPMDTPDTEVPTMITVSCDHCNNKWTVKENEVDNVKECPFCHTGAKE
jgi:hypothetical protein